MISQNLKEFSKNNIIQKEERVRIVSFNKSKLLFEREEEINNYLKNE